MFDLKTADVEIPCPECENNLEIIIQDVLEEKTVTCNKCSASVHLENNEVNNKIVNGLNNSFRELEKTLNRFGK